ncbi:DUF397 domain-containing protein [Streptomyces sp. JV178]|uniref:DUF397 domain-containing protein n=1 Tax=Streptomyces sp. JV178 TaxID=858632 RepID=UPI000C1B0D3F|nr:DUF397 domain-containing protein [Streptomyces sp. JV178]PIM71042.1 DUF397 domain-containing protein [Streptomyces sp. JV178]
MRLSRPDLSMAVWRRSSHSNAEGGNCVEIAPHHPTLVPIRDSKRPEGPALIVTTPAWSAFISHLKG